MSRLIFHPTVFAIASSAVHGGTLQSWVDFNPDAPLINYAGEETPLLGLLEDEGDDLERVVEFAGRHCYRSWSSGRCRQDYIKNLIQKNHGAVLEHSTITFAIQGISRSLSHELVRHRVGTAISQESQRYVEATGMKFVVPPLYCYLTGAEDDLEHAFLSAFERECLRALEAYTAARDYLEPLTALSQIGSERSTLLQKRANEAARAYLPNAAETRLVWTVNIRALRHFLQLRGGIDADLEIRRLAGALLDVGKITAPVFFSDFRRAEGAFGVDVIEHTPGTFL